MCIRDRTVVVTSWMQMVAHRLGLVICPISNHPGLGLALIHDEQIQADLIQLVQFYLH